MFTADHPLPVPADLLARPDIADKAAAYGRPLADLIRAGIAEARLPAALRELVAVPAVMDCLSLRGGFAAYARLGDFTSMTTVDALAGLERAGMQHLHLLIAARLQALAEAPRAERAALAEALDQGLAGSERRALANWPCEAFFEGAISRLCRLFPVEPLDGPGYREAIRALAGHLAAPPDPLEGDPTVPAALARLMLRELAVAPVEDSGTEVRQLPAAATLAGRVLHGEGAIEQRRRIVTELGTLYFTARVGRRIEVSVELEAADGRRSRLLSLSRWQTPKAMDLLEADLRRALKRAA